MKLLVVHPYFGRGGSEARALWITEALKDSHHMTIVTAGGISISELNAAYGTAIADEEVDVIETGLPWWLARLQIGDALKGNWFQRRLRKVSPKFDLILSAYNLVDVPVPTIQFIADFSWDDELRRKYHPSGGARGRLHNDSLLRRGYLKLANKVGAGNPIQAMHYKCNKVVANSMWTAGILRERYGVQCNVIYPPVVGDFPRVPVEQKKPRFVCIGRISPEKELEKIIAIIKSVRNRGYQVDLHIIGDWKSSAYGRQLVNHARQQGDWVRFEGDCRGEEKAKLLVESRFGIHGCTGEAFGIAVAEMVKAGCITFVPAEGGAAEIVSQCSLVYANFGDAVAKIVAVLKNDVMQRELFIHVIERMQCFSERLFMEEVADLIAEFDRAG